MGHNENLAWLGTRVGRAGNGAVEASSETSFETNAERLDEALFSLVESAGAGVVCEPTAVAATRRSHGHVIALVGWPTGRHHSLIKAAEARLAVDDGADEVWVAVDASAGVSAVLTDVIAVRQVIEEPTRFGVTLPGQLSADELKELAAGVEKAGVDTVSVDKRDADVHLPKVACDLAVHGRIDSLDEAADLLLAGASRVYPLG